MTGLNWFQAVGLARLEKRAIRQPHWERWLLFRNFLWIVSEMVNGAERLRIATNYDLGGPQYLAKNWTDEPWEGGSYPPCTTPGPAAKLAGNASGGAGTFTLSALCGGDGNGGTVPMETGPGVSQPLIPELEMAIVANGHATTYSPVTPDGEGCWITPPSTFYPVIAAAAGGVMDEAFLQWSLAGASLAGTLAFGEMHANADDGAISTSGTYLFGAAAFGPDWVAVRPPFPVTYTPGAIITARIDAKLPSGAILTGFVTLTLPPNC